MSKYLEVDILGGSGPKAAIFEVDKTVADRNRASKLFAQVQHADDAARLVACWNACQGVTTEALSELTNLGGLKYLDQTVAAQAEKLRALMAYRDQEQILRPGLSWNGKGLPPVGAGCEVNHESAGWRDATVVAHYEGFAVVVTDGGDLDAGIYQLDECRPILTDEQTAAKEREQAVTDIIMIIGVSKRNTAEDLYDAGYRKQVAE